MQPLKNETDKVRPNPPWMIIGMAIFLVVMLAAGAYIF